MYYSLFGHRLQKDAPGAPLGEVDQRRGQEEAGAHLECQQARVAQPACSQGQGQGGEGDM